LTLGLLLAASVAVPGLVRSRSANAAPATAWAMYLDCDPSAAGIQASCVYPTGTTSVDVAVVLKNVSGSAAAQVVAFNFDVLGDAQPTFSPRAGVNANLDGNPDFSQAGVGATDTWTCALPPPSPDQDPSPSATDSLLACYLPSGAGGPTVAQGATLVLGTVHYASIDGVGNFSLANVDVVDETGADLMTCNLNPDPGYTPGDCFTTAVQVGAPVDTATATVPATATSTPTATPTPCMGGPCATPTGVPTGAPTDALLLNSSSCLVLAVAYGGVDATGAASDCYILMRQYAYFGSMQHYVRCLRGYLGDYGRHVCIPDNGVDNPYRVLPSDFTKVDRDGDQLRAGQILNVIAFVSGDYPVKFSTDEGQFFDAQWLPLGAEYTCFGGDSWVPPFVGDPDCDGNPATAGDGVVVARLRVAEGDPLGDAHVTITQGDTSITRTFHVTGTLKSITLTPLLGKTALEPDATQGAQVTCSWPGDAAVADGLPGDTHSVVVLAKAFDAGGTELANALLGWTHVAGASDAIPQGAAALYQVPTIDLGGLGIGFFQRVCAGATPGAYTSVVAASNVLDALADPSAQATFSIAVAIPDADHDGVPDASDNCPSVANPGQANRNAEIIPLPKPLPAYNDATNPIGDFLGDACDPDIDHDGIPNAAELTLGRSPYIADTDGDRTNDGTEIKCGSDPLNPLSNLAGTDTDHDGLPDACEAVYGTDPHNPDTDGDGVLDGVEVRYWMTNPLVKDTDGDRCADGQELASVNADRAVSAIDLQQVAMHFGAPTPEFQDFDMNGDGRVNSIDLLFVAQHFGPCRAG